jgi:crotonobetainyl-CoA:carnitine CoA-transferase CaiB-like acyl-CoA transferase
MAGRPPISGELVVDLSTGIAGAYCTKVLADGGADVVKVEAPGGDPLRRWSASGAAIAEGDDAALFRFLGCSKRSALADPSLPEDVAFVRDLVAGADGVIWSPGSPLATHRDLAPGALRELAPQATVLTITSFGLAGPWADRPATEATLQAWSGSAGLRGEASGPPFIAGGRLGEWETGLVAAVAYLISRHRRVAAGVGELVDVSAFEAQCLTNAMYPVTYLSIAGRPMRDVRMVNLPNVHATKDGFVGFMVVTGQQWLDFAAMIERPDWVEDESLIRVINRVRRRAELLGWIDSWMGQRTSDEIAELATLFRIPVAVLGSGASLPRSDHLVEQGFFVENPRGGFVQPDVAYTLGGSTERRAVTAAPRLGEHTGELRASLLGTAGRSTALTGPAPVERPFGGLRVADFTANWAGPVIGQVLAGFGADVIRIESPRRPDALRSNTIRTMADDQWWEWSPLAHGPNTSKRGLTLDMASERGRELALRLIAECDVVVENYSPRVMDAWGFTAEVVLGANPRTIFLRAPAYGLHGPWRERVGYAQTIEMTAGLAWVTGPEDGPPDIPNGACDPIAGLHATIALLLALEHRRRTGEGTLVECPMVGGALNVAAEQVVEYSAYGVVLQREGNRSPVAAPQNAYRTATDDLPHDQGRWVLVSVETDAQWDALCGVLGRPAWAADPALTTHAERRRAHDAIDEHLAAWCASREADDIVEQLWSAGVPVGKVLLPHEVGANPQLAARGWFSTLRHPVTGDNVHGGFPAIFSAGPAPASLHAGAPPMLGQHNHEILGGLLGLTDVEIAQLEAAGVIGTDPGRGGLAW